MRFGIQHLHLRVRACAAVAASLVLLLSPVWAGGKKVAPKPVDITKLVWPPPPDKPRVRYISEYYGEFDLMGKKQAKGGILERMAGVSVAPEERPRMIKPYGLAVDSKGRIYVTDTMKAVVFVFDLENKKLEFRGDNAPANLELPVGLAVDEKDRLFVSDSKTHQITCFNSDGTFESAFGAADLRRPGGMAVDDALHRLYVVDGGGKRIAIFDLDSLKLLRYIGQIKSGGDINEGMDYPNSIAIDPDGLIYVTDAVIARVVVYDTEGNFVRSWGKRGDAAGLFGRPRGIAIDADGHVYVADALLNRMQIFSPEGTPLLAVGGNGVGPGQFMLMAGVAIDRKNRIIAVDQTPARIEIFHYITDVEAASGKTEEDISAKPVSESAAHVKAVAPAQAPQPAPSPAASSGPTVEELQKQLEELKAKIAAQQQQKSDEQKPANAKQAPDGADKPAQEVSNSPK
jgi:DNA-binding beta-propeller fold protein YncE